MMPATTLRPMSEAELVDCVRDARANRTPLLVQGGGTRMSLGRPSQSARTLSTAGLSGITLLEPAEMVVSARAGTPLSVVESALAEKGQRFAFEPMDHRPLLGSDGEPSLGAVAAMNNSGSSRIAFGAARDSLVGVRFVNGHGDAIKNGGRVMKNVTGLDLVKLISGSFGTLGILSEVTFKVLPLPESTTTLVYKNLSDVSAIKALTRSIGSPFEITGAAHLPPGMGRDIARTFIRIEGFEDSVSYRISALKSLLSEFGIPNELQGDDGRKLWKGIRDVSFLADRPDTVIWRVCVKPTDGPKLLDTIGVGSTLRHYYDWGGGLVWLEMVADADAGEAKIRAATRSFGGHARIERAPLEIRARLDMFDPLAPPVRQLTAGIKTSFDPDGILNAGRMYSGI